MIRVKNISYTYKVFEKKSGFKGSIKDFFSRKYKEMSALNNITFEIAEGESIGLLGANGAGKTTLIKLLTGIIEPVEGEVDCLNFTPYKKNRKYLSKIGVVLGQKSQLIWDLPAKETLEMLKVIYNIETAQFNQRLKELAVLLNVENKLNIPVRKLSLGERMKFEIICSLIHSPKILYLDEPTIGLDIISQQAIRNFLKKINKIEQITIILTSHYMKDIEAVSDRVIILSEGQLLDDIPIQELKNKYKNDSKINIKFINNIPSEFRQYSVSNDSIRLNLNEYKRIRRLLNLEDIYSINSEEQEFEEIVYNLINR